MNDGAPTWEELFALIKRTVTFRHFNLKTKRRRPPVKRAVPRRRRR